MTKGKKRLGKGLDALLPGFSGQAVDEIPLDSISPNPYQPRQDFDEAGLEELVESIKAHGVVQPLILRRQGEGSYQLVAGERRWRAARRAGLSSVPAIIRQMDESEMLEIALIENLQREDLNPVEEARAYRVLIDEFGLTQEQLAERLGKSRPQVANTLRLLHLQPDVLALLGSGQLSVGHAKVLLGSSSQQVQSKLARAVAQDGLTVRQLEKRVATDGSARESKKASRPAEQARQERDAAVLDLESRMARLLGTRVNIRQGRRKGRVEIEFFGPEDLNRILEILKIV